MLPHVARDALAAVEAESLAAGIEEREGGGGETTTDPALGELLAVCHEAVTCGSCVGLALRPAIGAWVFLRLCASSLSVEELSVSEYLTMKECAVG